MTLQYRSNDLAVQIKNLRDWGSDPRGLSQGGVGRKEGIVGEWSWVE